MKRFFDLKHQTPPTIGWSRWEIFAVALCLGMLVLACYHVVINSSRTWDYNGIRLQRSFVLAAGESIYPGRASGPILNAIYGPVAAVAYLPATILRTPVTAVLMGQMMSLLFFFLPAALLLRGASRARDSEDRRLEVAGFCLFAVLAIDLRCLEYVAFSIHVDAPALSLGLLAWIALLRRRWSLAALLAALAVWTKIMLLPLLLAMPAWTLLTHGWRQAMRLSIWMAGALTLVSGVMVMVFGPADHLFFNIWTVPSLHLSDPGVSAAALKRGALRLLVENAVVWLLWVSILVLSWTRSCDWKSEAVLACGFLGLFLAPLSVLGLLKVGGDINAFAYTVYFVLIGTVVSWVRGARESWFARRVLIFTPCAVLAVILGVQIPEFINTWREPLRASRWSHQIAYDYALAHPGEIYFPRITLASILAEGRIYHQSVGLWDRRLAGQSPDTDHYWQYLPTNLQGVAVLGNGESENELIMPPEFKRVTRDPDLPGFVVYRRETYQPPNSEDSNPAYK